MKATTVKLAVMAAAFVFIGADVGNAANAPLGINIPPDDATTADPIYTAPLNVYLTNAANLKAVRDAVKAVVWPTQANLMPLQPAIAPIVGGNIMGKIQPAMQKSLRNTLNPQGISIKIAPVF